MGLQLSGSIQLEGNLLVTGSANSVFENVLVSGKLTAQEIETQLVSSSIIYSSGSNKFGDLVTDTQQFTGSVDVSGSLSVNGNLQATTLVRTGGISTQFLKADGSVDSNSYALTSSLDNYLLLSGGTLTGTLNGTSAVFSGTGAFTGNFAIGESVRTTSTLVINNTNAKNELTFGGSEFTNIYSETTSGLQFGITTTGNNAAIEFLTNNQTRLTLASTGAATFSSSIATNGYTANPSFAALFNGNVGIGTTDPSAKLHIEGDASSTTDETILTLKGNGENGKRIDFRNTFGSLARITGTKLGSFASADEGVLIFETATNSVLSEKMRITSAGEINILNSFFLANSSGGYRFNNQANSFNNFIIFDNGNATLRGTLTQGASDERLKNNIEIIPNAIDKIKQLRGVSFEWNQEIYETSRTTDIGVIAQDVQSIFPDAVSLAPFDTNYADYTSKSGENYLTVYYEKLIPLLIEGIKELKTEIDSLKNQIL